MREEWGLGIKTIRKKGKGGFTTGHTIRRRESSRGATENESVCKNNGSAQEFLQKDTERTVKENAFCSDTLTWHQQQHIILHIFCSPSTAEWERNHPQILGYGTRAKGSNSYKLIKNTKTVSEIIKGSTPALWLFMWRLDKWAMGSRISMQPAWSVRNAGSIPIAGESCFYFY